jgi:hypothetical protein
MSDYEQLMHDWNTLLDSCRDALQAFDKDVCDVLWVGSCDGKFSMNWDDFVLLGSELPWDLCLHNQLVLAGKNWSLERCSSNDELYGFFWSYTVIPMKSEKAVAFTIAPNSPISAFWGLKPRD